MKAVIVESPSKARIISEYLGKDFKVFSSKGHIREIPSKPGMVHFKRGILEVQWGDLPHLKSLIKEISNWKFTEIFIATDLDREGERIAMDLFDLLKGGDYIIKRIVFSAVTKEKLLEAIKLARDINFPLARAAQARTAIDYYLGYTLSPLLWKYVPGAKSMGRVQCPALTWISYIEVNNLNKESIQELKVTLISGDIELKASFEGSWLEIISDFRSFSKELKLVNRIFKSPSLLPFSTLELQKHANQRFGISASKLMSILQDLYSGASSEKAKGSLITYMRTDSRRFDSSFVKDAIVHLFRNGFSSSVDWNKSFSMTEYKGNSAQVQDAHEGIRPIKLPSPNLNLEPISEKILNCVTNYSLSCFLRPSEYKEYGLKTSCGRFKSNFFYKLLKPGNMQIYPLRNFSEGKDFTFKGGPTKLKGIRFKFSFKNKTNWTHPSESRLISEMQKLGVGRPSTWATILPTLRSRRYVSYKNLNLEHLGFLVFNFMRKNFYEFTTGSLTSWMEDQLNLIEEGKDYNDSLRKMVLYLMVRAKRSSKLELDLRLIPRECCGKPMSLFYSLKKGGFVFFKCGLCEKSFPFNYRPDRIANQFVHRGKLIFLPPYKSKS